MYSWLWILWLSGDVGLIKLFSFDSFSTRGNLHSIINHFKVNRSVAFSTFTVLCIHRLCLDPKHFYHPQEETCTHYAVTLHFLFFQFLETTHPLSGTLGLFCVFHKKGIAWFENMFFWPISLTSIIFFKFLHITACISTVPFYGWLLFLYFSFIMDIWIVLPSIIVGNLSTSICIKISFEKQTSL